MTIAHGLVDVDRNRNDSLGLRQRLTDFLVKLGQRVERHGWRIMMLDMIRHIPIVQIPEPVAFD